MIHLRITINDIQIDMTGISIESYNDSMKEKIVDCLNGFFNSKLTVDDIQVVSPHENRDE